MSSIRLSYCWKISRKAAGSMSGLRSPRRLSNRATWDSIAESRSARAFSLLSGNSSDRSQPRSS